MPHQLDGKAHRPTAVIEDSKAIQLTKRIRVLIEVTELTREECREVIMQGKNLPTEEEFHLAWNAARILTRQDQRYSEELNLGLPT